MQKRMPILIIGQAIIISKNIHPTYFLGIPRTRLPWSRAENPRSRPTVQSPRLSRNWSGRSESTVVVADFDGRRN